MLYARSDKKPIFKSSLNIDIPPLTTRHASVVNIFSPKRRTSSFYNFCRDNDILTSPKSEPKPLDFDFETDLANIKFTNGIATRVRLNTKEEIRFDTFGEPTSSYKEGLDDRLEQLMNTLKSTCVPHREPMNVETPIDRYFMNKKMSESKSDSKSDSKSESEFKSESKSDS